MAFRLVSLILSLSLFCQQAGIAYASGELNLVNYLSQARSAIVQPDRFQPARLRYISYDINNNDFKLLLDKGDAKLNDSTKELFSYFLIGLALPNDTFWVNLRPDAPENIIDPLLEKTDIGKIFLEADLQLKKDTASLTSPQNPEGKLYWDKLYKKAGELFPAAGGSAFGGENITIPTITRPWIVPNEVIVRETEDSAYIYKATLKVMLEADYLQNQKTEEPKNGRTEELKNRRTEGYVFSDPRLKELNEYSSQIIRETIIPKLTKEINSSKRYAKLRQVYYSLVLSRWFKQKYSGPGSARALEHQGAGASANSYLSLINSGNLANLASPEPCDKQAYFQAYQKSFKDGEYNLKETIASPYGQSIRSYISGGLFITSSPMEGLKTNENPYLDSLILGSQGTVVSSAINDDGRPDKVLITPEGIMKRVNEIFDNFLVNVNELSYPLSQAQKEKVVEVINKLKGGLNELVGKERRVGKILNAVDKVIKDLDGLEEIIDTWGMPDSNKFPLMCMKLRASLSYIAEEAGGDGPVSNNKLLREYSRRSGSPIRSPHKTEELLFWNGGETEIARKAKETIFKYVRRDKLEDEQLKAAALWLRGYVETGGFWESKINSLKMVIEGIEERDEGMLSNLRFAFSEDGNFRGCVEVLNKKDDGGNLNLKVNFVAGMNQWIEIALTVAAIQELADNMQSEGEYIVLNNIRRDNPYVVMVLDPSSNGGLSDNILELNIGIGRNVVVLPKRNINIIINKFYLDIKEIIDSNKKLLELIRETFPSSGAVADSPLGGIDFTGRAMRLNIERVGSFADLRLVLPEVKNAQDIDLDKEFKQIEAIASNGIVPNSRRILELFSACYGRGEFGQRLPQVISCLKASSAIQENLGLDSDDDFRLALIVPEALTDGS